MGWVMVIVQCPQPNLESEFGGVEDTTKHHQRGIALWGNPEPANVRQGRQEKPNFPAES